MARKKNKLGYQMGGTNQGSPAASFVEPPIEQPFAAKSQFVAKSGGVKKKAKKAVIVKKKKKGGKK
tara:strand:+ start:431 stop:628 length:198 start_codon:yes stop_codon:yes gene_type:complete